MKPTPPPKVSVILPTYNRARFLQEAIRSVLEQSLADFELIVIDDGATDQTTEMVASFADQRIRYEKQLNQGRSVARNRGLQLARGRYITFLDDDDSYLPGKLSTQAKYLDQHDAVDLVAGGAIIVNASGQPVAHWAGWDSAEAFVLLNFLKNCPFLITTVMIRRSVLENMSDWFDRSLEPAEDTDLFDRLALMGCRMAWDRQWVAHYRQHPVNSQGNARGYRDSKLKILEKIFNRPDLPPDLRTRQDEIRAHFHLSMALYAFAVGETELGREEFTAAIELDPPLNQGPFPTTIHAIAGFANFFLVQDPASFLKGIWKQLPPQFQYRFHQRLQVLSLFHMQRAFSAYSLHGPPAVPLGDWIKGVALNPGWLLDGSARSIALRTLLHPCQRFIGRAGK